MNNYTKMNHFPVYLAFQSAPKIKGDYYSTNQRSVRSLLKTTDDGMYPMLYAETLCTESQAALNEYHDFMEQLCECDPKRAISLHSRVMDEMKMQNASHTDLMHVAQLLQRKGRNGDTILAHITPEEARHLKDHGGAGTRNPETGLMEFWVAGFGSDTPGQNTMSKEDRENEKLGGPGIENNRNENRQLDLHTPNQTNQTTTLGDEGLIQATPEDALSQQEQQTAQRLSARRTQIAAANDLAAQEEDRDREQAAQEAQQARVVAAKKTEDQLTEKQKITRVENWKANINTLTMPDIPDNKSDYAAMPEHLKSYNDFYNNLISLSGITQNMVNAAMRVFTQEGFLEKNPENGVVAGILEKTLNDTFNETGIPKDTPSEDLTTAQRAAIYMAHFNRALKNADGVKTFDQIPDETGRQLIADMAFRNGKYGTGRIIQDAINEIVPGTFGKPKIIDDRVFGKTVMNKFNEMLADPKLRSKLLNNIADLRAKKYDENWRNDPFRD